jgi:hypothetical protein
LKEEKERLGCHLTSRKAPAVTANMTSDQKS